MAFQLVPVKSQTQILMHRHPQITDEILHYRKHSLSVSNCGLVCCETVQSGSKLQQDSQLPPSALT